jgi:hypothetical protein
MRWAWGSQAAISRRPVRDFAMSGSRAAVRRRVSDLLNNSHCHTYKGDLPRVRCNAAKWPPPLLDSIVGVR